MRDLRKQATAKQYLLLHDLILSDARVGVRVHAVIAAAGLEVPHEAETQGTTAVLVTLELGDGSVRGVGTVEPNDTGAARAPTRLVLDLSLLDLANSGEEIDQILVTCGPRELWNH